ncbi:24588_t:CDS:1 [Dentiscutata erythropus]|uniref:24588_t:CDS:1 n=1 Tax=Dentiscutata erythropus TaxID=1348616 RepID=A0A9N9GH05_9GLOM|nr:24588_t:CDS:1 [Dentiscutata erythropus]
MKQNNTSSNSTRSCIFIDSSNPNSPNQVVNLNSQPFIKPAFPPTVNVRELMTKQSSGRTSVRGPNAFIIYRKVFFEKARDDGYQLPMTIVSSMASQSWEQEPEIVKELYRELAKEANKIRNEISPKSPRRKKREQWNIVSFQPNNKTKMSKSRSSRATPCPLTPPMSPTESSSIISEMSFDEACPKSSDREVKNSFSNIDNIDSKSEIETKYIPTNEFDALVGSSILQQLNEYEYGYNDYDSSTEAEQITPTTPTELPLGFWRGLPNDTLITTNDAIIFSNTESVLDSTITSIDDGFGIPNHMDIAAANGYIFMNSEESSYLLDLIPIMDIADDPGIVFSSDGLSFNNPFISF